MNVSWTITRGDGVSYKLHNVGSSTAAIGVTILEDGLDGLGRDLPDGVAVPPWESIRFLMLEVDQLPSADPGHGDVAGPRTSGRTDALTSRECPPLP